MRHLYSSSWSELHEALAAVLHPLDEAKGGQLSCMDWAMVQHACIEEATREQLHELRVELTLSTRNYHMLLCCLQGLSDICEGDESTGSHGMQLFCRYMSAATKQHIMSKTDLACVQHTYRAAAKHHTDTSRLLHM